MKKIMIFMSRQDSISKRNIFETIGSTLLVYSIVAYATKDNVCVIFESTKSCVFSMCIASVWCGLCSTISLYSTEKNHIFPFIQDGLLRPGTYLLGTLVIQTFISVIQAVIGTIIFTTSFDYSREGIVLWNADMDILLTLFLIIESSATLGLFLGMLISDIKSAMSILPLVLIVQMLFSKGIFELKGRLDIISEYVIARFGIASLGSILDINQYPIAVRVAYPIVDQKENTLFQATSDYLINCWLHMSVLAIIPFIAAYFLMCFRKRTKK